MKKSGVNGRKVKNFGKKLLKNLLLSKTFYNLFKVVSFVLLIIIILYSLYFYLHQTIGQSVIVSQSEILNRVSKQIVLPKETPISVTRVQKPEELSSQNDFYKDVKEGDYIIVYKSEIIIYDFMRDKVIGVKN